MAASDYNPFVGPRSLTLEDGIHGRDREIRELRWLFTAERIVWLHAPSGAGKTSLVQAGLIPELRERRFDVLPVIRLNGEGGENRYEASALSSLGRKEGTLYNYLSGGAGQSSRVLIFDQFEEVLTLDSADIEAKQAFFESLGRALEFQDVWALFVVREDFLAPLDPYARALSTLMNHRFRLDLLSVENAMEAVQQIAAKGMPKRTLSSQALELLGNRLSERKVGESWKPGKFVEPVILQVVCRSMWQGKLPVDSPIGTEHIPTSADVRKSLAQFYASSVKAVSPTTSEESDVRDWVEQKLIVSGFRNQLLDVKNDGAGLDREKVVALENIHHLIHTGKRGDLSWYELQHDRLVEPVIEDNRSWKETNLSWVEKRANLWREQGRGKAGLLLGEELKKAQLWIAESKPGMRKLQDFLIASEDEQKVRDTIRMGKILGLVLINVITIALVATAYFHLDARSRELTGQARAEILRGDRKNAVEHAAAALEWTRYLNSGLHRNAMEGLEEVLAGVPVPGSPEIGYGHVRLAYSQEMALLAVANDVRVDFYRGSPTLSKPSGSILADTCKIALFALSKDGAQVALALDNGEVQTAAVPSGVRRVVSTKPSDNAVQAIEFSSENVLAVARTHGLEIGGKPAPLDALSLAFRPDGRQLAVGMRDGTVRILEGVTEISSLPFVEAGKAVKSLAWGSRALAYASDASPFVRLSDGRGLEDYSSAGLSGVTAVVFSPSGSLLAAVGALTDYRAVVWRVGVKTPLLELRTPKATEELTGAVFVDDHHLQVAYRDGKVRIFPLDLSSLREAADRILACKVCLGDN